MIRFYKLYIIVFITVFVLSNTYSYNAFAQVKSTDNISIKQAINKISKIYNVKFSYSSDKIDLKKKVIIQLNGNNLEEDLNKLSSLTELKFTKLNNSIIISPQVLKHDKITISGFIRESSTKEHLPEIIIQNLKDQQFTYSNNFGYYSLTIPYTSDTLIIQAQMLGYKSEKKYVSAKEYIRLDWELESMLKLEDIEIQDTRIDDKAFHKSIIMDQIDDDTRERTPRLLGEKDVLAATRYYSGVNRETDVSSGYTVRGGSIDQNLVIIDDAPIYHAFHSFGLYSVMNEDALKQMNLIKSGFPARYGGRLSSVVELITKDGDMQNYQTEIGTGLIATKLSTQGPIVKDRLTFLLSGRMSHINRLLSIFSIDSQNVKYRFDDFNAKLVWKINNKNRLFFSAYSGSDRFIGTEGTQGLGFSSRIGWGNTTATLRWNHIFHPKWFSNTSLIYTDYNAFSFQGDQMVRVSFESGVRDYIFKHDLDYFKDDKQHIKAGAQFIFHQYTPSNSLSYDTLSNYTNKYRYYNEEFALYIEDEVKYNSKFSFNIGSRFSGYHFRNKIRFYWEPRLMTTYLLSDRFAFKSSYGRMIQYAHFINSTIGIGLPTDLWIPSTNKIKPQISDQFTTGVFYNDKKHWKIGLEAYYKMQHQVITNGPNANILSSIFNFENPNDTLTWDDKVMSGETKSYGIEAQIEYKHAKFGTMTAYTLSYTRARFDRINDGNWFWANTDRRHNFSTSTWLKLSKNWTFNTAWVFTTGIPFTLPESSYLGIGHEPGNVNESFGMSQNTVIYFFNEFKGKNIYRMSNYHRLDINFSYERKYEGSELDFQIGIVNVYNRKNPIYYTINQNPVTYKNELRKIAFMGIMPSMSISYKF